MSERRQRARKIVLASSSPRRRELLRLTGLRFLIDHSDFEEVLTQHVQPERLARRLSYGKASAVASRHGDALIIAADTFITLRGAVLGKPHTPEEARRMLMLLNGRSHVVTTGVTVLDTRTSRKSSFAVSTKVFFKKMSEQDIDGYIATGEPLDKAGAYAIQGLGAFLVRKIEGDYFNVIGLPLSALADALKPFGIRVPYTGE